MKEKELKFEEDNIFIVVREEIIENVVDEYGRQHIIKKISVKVPKQDEDFNLGSINNPKNIDVKDLRWLFPKNILRNK